VRLTHPHLHALVEHLQERHRVDRPSVDPGDRHRATPADDVDRVVQRREPVDAGLLHQRRRDRAGQQADELLCGRRTRRAVCLHADRVDDGIGTPAGGEFAQLVGTGRVEVEHFDAMARRHVAPFRDRVDGDHACSPMAGDPSAHLADGSEPEDDHRASRRDGGEVDRLPRRWQDVGQEEEAFVGRPVGHLDRPELRLRDAQVLGLPARHLPTVRSVHDRLPSFGRAFGRKS
jgi:hypothetical protein